jgi:hypothetical protein
MYYKLQKPFSYDFLLNSVQDLAISVILRYQPETAHPTPLTEKLSNRHSSQKKSTPFVVPLRRQNERHDLHHEPQQIVFISHVPLIPLPPRICSALVYNITRSFGLSIRCSLCKLHHDVINDSLSSVGNDNIAFVRVLERTLLFIYP